MTVEEMRNRLMRSRSRTRKETITTFVYNNSYTDFFQ